VLSCALTLPLSHALTFLSRGDDPLMNLHQASREYLAAEVEGSDPVHRLVLLHEGAARFIREAVDHIGRRDFARAHDAFGKAKNIVMHFLGSIPEGDDSELAANLRGLFKYTYHKLVEGNLRKDPQSAQEALTVIRNLRDGWAALARERKTPLPPPAAPRPPGLLV